MLAYPGRAEARLAEYVQTFGPAGQMSTADFVAIHARTRSAPDARRIGRWRVEMSPDDLHRYERIAGPLLAELGYSPAAPPLLAPVAGA